MTTQTTAQQLVSTLISTNFTNAELNAVADALRFARAQLARTVLNEFKAGQAVAFTNPKTGQRFTGKVNRVKTKYVLVDTAQGVRYNVPANMLEAAA